MEVQVFLQFLAFFKKRRLSFFNRGISLPDSIILLYSGKVWNNSTPLDLRRTLGRIKRKEVFRDVSSSLFSGSFFGTEPLLANPYRLHTLLLGRFLFAVVFV